MNYGFTREEIIDKIEMLISKSHTLSRGLIDYAKDLDDDELEKFLILVYENTEREKKLTLSAKEKTIAILKTHFSGVINLFDKYISQLIRKREQQEINNSIYN